MEVSSTTAGFVAQAHAPQQQSQVRAPQAQVTGSDGVDRENDGDADDKAKVTATRGQNTNVIA